MNLIKAINYALNDNFANNECNISDLINMCSLYFIDSNKTIYYVEKISSDMVCQNVVSLCFVKHKVLYCVATHKEYQNLGYGKLLLQQIVNNNDFLQLNVRISNRNAIKLYKNVGFKIVNLLKNFYSYTSNIEDAYVMEYSV